MGLASVLSAVAFSAKRARRQGVIQRSHSCEFVTIRVPHLSELCWVSDASDVRRSHAHRPGHGVLPAWLVAVCGDGSGFDRTDGPAWDRPGGLLSVYAAVGV